ncbi:MAG: hypothetical protein EOP28_00365 [Rhodococcus sp. (in: high G+C Gram-positive bacteria)]|nr:MAG: hypothetical protein EOP28_00365 [Rhodococcus sp. (in: high G+C Gram-positive bacteria)]
MPDFRLIYDTPANAYAVMQMLLGAVEYNEDSSDRIDRDDLQYLLGDGEYTIGFSTQQGLVLKVPEQAETSEVPEWITPWESAGQFVRNLDSYIRSTEIWVKGIELLSD